MVNNCFGRERALFDLLSAFQMLLLALFVATLVYSARRACFARTSGSVECCCSWYRSAFAGFRKRRGVRQLRNTSAALSVPPYLDAAAKRRHHVFLSLRELSKFKAVWTTVRGIRSLAIVDVCSLGSFFFTRRDDDGGGHGFGEHGARRRNRATQYSSAVRVAPLSTRVTVPSFRWRCRVKITLKTNGVCVCTCVVFFQAAVLCSGFWAL